MRRDAAGFGAHLRLTLGAGLWLAVAAGCAVSAPSPDVRTRFAIPGAAPAPNAYARTVGGRDDAAAANVAVRAQDAPREPAACMKAEVAMWRIAPGSILAGLPWFDELEAAIVFRLTTALESQTCAEGFETDGSAPADACAPSGTRNREVTECDLREAPTISADSATGRAAWYAAFVRAAQDALADGRIAEAWICADRAVDRDGDAALAYILRGEALAQLDRAAEAEVDFTLALTLAPRDTDVLLSAAQHYISGPNAHVAGPTKARLGLALAERGFTVAGAGLARGAAKAVAADFAALQAQAFNVLGRADAALGAAAQALRLVPTHAMALFERATALFDLHQFGAARAEVETLLRHDDADADAHHLLGLILEWEQQAAAADVQFARARALAPEDYPVPPTISTAEFEAEVQAVLASLPAAQQAALQAVRFEVAEVPLLSDLSAVTPPFPPTILGLFRGGSDGPLAAAPSIVLYRRNLVRAVKSRAELSAQIRETVLHEIGHFDGLDEDDLRRRGLD